MVLLLLHSAAILWQSSEADVDVGQEGSEAVLPVLGASRIAPAVHTVPEQLVPIALHGHLSELLLNVIHGVVGAIYISV